MKVGHIKTPVSNIYLANNKLIAMVINYWSALGGWVGGVRWRKSEEKGGARELGGHEKN